MLGLKLKSGAGFVTPEMNIAVITPEFGKTNVTPVRLLGYRSVPLKNSYSEDLELASLLVHMDIIRGRVGYEIIVCRNAPQ